MTETVGDQRFFERMYSMGKIIDDSNSTGGVAQNFHKSSIRGEAIQPDVGTFKSHNSNDVPGQITNFMEYNTFDNVYDPDSCEYLSSGPVPMDKNKHLQQANHQRQNNHHAVASLESSQVPSDRMLSNVQYKNGNEGDRNRGVQFISDPSNHQVQNIHKNKNNNQLPNNQHPQHVPQHVPQAHHQPQAHQHPQPQAHQHPQHPQYQPSHNKMQFYQPYTCPICRQIASRTCDCSDMDSTCPSGHQWHFVNNSLQLGPSAKHA